MSDPVLNQSRNFSLADRTVEHKGKKYTLYNLELQLMAVMTIRHGVIKFVTPEVILQSKNLERDLEGTIDDLDLVVARAKKIKELRDRKNV